MKIFFSLSVLFFLAACSKKESTSTTPPVVPAGAFSITSFSINGNTVSGIQHDVNLQPVIRIKLSAPVDRSTTASNIYFSTGAAFSTAYENNDSTIIISPVAVLTPLTRYAFTMVQGLKSVQSVALSSQQVLTFITKIDSSRKFPAISDNALLDLVQQQTFKYFYDFGHPVSGLSRERNTSGDLVTTGGSGFGIMALIAGTDRNFITHAQGLARMQTIVAFLKNTAQTFHGAYPHWMNGITGAVIPFSPNDNGADLVETGFLMEGLLCARQYFNAAAANETSLRADINTIFNRVEWDWFRQGSQNVLTWHWSPTVGFALNVQIRGWDEALMPYVLGASSTTHPIPPAVYSNGWASNGGMVNGHSFYGYPLPLGPDFGGPLFFEQYSLLGINPNGLNDVYANYATQTKNHTLINYNYCVANPRHWFGYSDSCWGLTASDIPNGYTASSPTNDQGVIAPTAALASFPYTPTESMKALKFYYYVLGDKLWKPYGFVDAFKLDDPWFADSFLAIDQGPIIVNIENYRSGLLWNLFTSCPEVKTGMLSLGFTAPYL